MVWGNFLMVYPKPPVLRLVFTIKSWLICEYGFDSLLVFVLLFLLCYFFFCLPTCLLAFLHSVLGAKAVCLMAILFYSSRPWFVHASGCSGCHCDGCSALDNDRKIKTLRIQSIACCTGMRIL